MNDNSSILSMLESSGALLKGHFELSSGLHSEYYFQCALFLQHPKQAARAGEALALKVKEIAPACVAGLALGAIPLAHEVARSLNLHAIFVERKEGKMCLRRGFSVQRKERVLVVEDVITTGGSVREAISLLKSFGVDVIGVASLVDRSTAPIDFGCTYFSLIKVPTQTFDPSNCPLCKKGIPLDKPGSKSVKST